MKKQKPKAIVVGGSIAGESCTKALVSAGWDVVVIEKTRGPPTQNPTGAGLGLDPLAQKIVQSWLHEPELLYNNTLPITITENLATDGETKISWVIGREEGTKFLTAYWADLHGLIYNTLPPEIFLWGHQYLSFCISEDKLTVKVRAKDLETDEIIEIVGDLLVGADGILSSIGQSILPDFKLRYTGYCAWRGVFNFSENDSETILGIRKSYPDIGKCFYTNIGSGSHIVVTELKKEKFNWVWYVNQPEPELKTITWDRVVLTGDAAHPTTPHSARSTNMAIIDAAVLGKCLEKWGPDHLYLRQHSQIDAHVGAVNDLAFAYPNKLLCVVTCGDDKLIKVWELSGRKLFNFEGHEAPVYSICPHHKENIQFIFSTAIDGKIKAWLYDTMGSRVDYDAPGHWCTTMLYSADGSRLFSCGTSKDGDSFLVEWNESEGTIKRTYAGFRKKSNGVVQFDTTQNHFLAVGEDSQIKFWDMDNVNILTSTDAEGGLPNLPRLRFSKEGNLLAVTTADNGFKILANAIGLRSLRAVENPPFEALRTPIESVALKVSASSAVSSGTPANCKVERSSPVRPSPIINGVDPTSRSMDKPRTVDDVTDKPKPWQLAEIVDNGQCRLVTMPESTDTSSKVVRLLYTNSAVGLLALGSNGVQKLWKWHRNEQNPSGKATASAVPQHWLPSSGLLMANDVAGVNLEEAVPCIALSKNDSYVMSATGGKISLFNMMTFKVMTTFMSPPPASTFLAFHPQDNNIIAIGTEDSTIHIYNVRVDEVKSKLKGHQKRITGLAFSTSLNILVSSGADAQLCVWSIDTWEKRKSVTIHIPAGKTPTGDTRVQFNADQVRMLVVHETQLAIYDASKMERIRQWMPQDALSAPISCAVYSCNSQLVFATFCDGNIGVFDADTLRLRCYIAPSTYLSPSVLNGSQTVYPLVVAAHPLEPNQFAIGLTDGSVKVMEPSESEGKWGVSPPVDNGILNSRTTSSSTSNHTPDQLQR